MNSKSIKKRILVTGGTATVGDAMQNLVSDYPEYEFFFVGSKDCNLLDLSAVKSFLVKNRIDSIIHLAAISGGIELSIKHPATLLRDNILMNINVLEAARLCEIKKVVMTLSTGMYPTKVAYPIKEEYIHDGEPHPSNYSYAFAKRLVEPMIRAYRTEYNLSVVGVVPNGILGPRSNFNTKSSTMVPALIRRFYENKDKQSKITIWGDGSPLREITSAKDIARACLWCLDNYDDPQILHIGTIEEFSVKEFAHLVADILTKKDLNLTLQNRKVSLEKTQIIQGLLNYLNLNIHQLKKP